MKGMRGIANIGYADACESQAHNWSKAILWLNLFLSILIVFLHTNLESAQIAYVRVKKVIDVLADMATPAFFGVSAYCSFRNYRMGAYFSVLRKKCVSLLVPYIAWNFCGYLYRVCLSFLEDAGDWTFSIHSLLLSEYNAPLWFC